MKENIIFITLVLSLSILTTGALAGPNDGGHWFSVDPDIAFGAPGGVYYSVENGGYFQSGLLNTGGQELDALSSGRHDFATLSDIFSYSNTVYWNYSIDTNSSIYSNVYERQITGVTSSTSPWIHDRANDLGVPEFADLDALESDTHSSKYAHPFSSHGEPRYFSLEGAGARDVGDIYWGSVSQLYLQDDMFAPIIGFDPFFEQLDSLIVFDVHGVEGEFSGGSSLETSDAIFFTLAPGVFDPVGDNIYYYSAYNGGTGGLYNDPGDSTNWDALDVHMTPEPVSSTLFIIGGATLGFRRFRKKFKK
jgi:hypothetical protein